LSKGTILIVEDEEDIREILGMHLASAGFAILEAENGAQAIDVIAAQKTDSEKVRLIICDIRMPEVNGLEAVEFFHDRAPEIPVIVVTGFADNTLENNLMAKGVKKFLIKPLEKLQLLQAVEEVLA
jgi:two-component system chemotaxis response regulator CheY